MMQNQMGSKLRSDKNSEIWFESRKLKMLRAKRGHAIIDPGRVMCRQNVFVAFGQEGKTAVQRAHDVRLRAVAARRY